MSACLSLAGRIVAALVLLLPACTTAGVATGLLGAWRAEVYELADGSQQQVSGQILCTRSDWTVLFLITADGQVQRGSGEGGSYLVEAEGRLVFHHLYNLSYGEELPGLPASPLRMQVHGEDGIVEPCRYQLAGDRLRLFFPSGNAMLFRRSSR